VLEIEIATIIWKTVRSMGALDSLPIAAHAGTQVYVPMGPALELFDTASTKGIIETYN
jgi:hypothetical protein